MVAGLLGLSLLLLLLLSSTGPERLGHDAADEGLALALAHVRVRPPPTGEDADLGLVHALVGLVPFDVFVPVLGGGDGEDDDEREDDEAGGDGGEDGEELEEGDACEEAVLRVRWLVTVAKKKVRE